MQKHYIDKLTEIKRENVHSKRFRVGLGFELLLWLGVRVSVL